ncbi:Vacuolar protein sorting-associated protein 62 [Vermiconidia calcicola]|uniref:Vacuolar protein sorting-associated protein 62 n=1 Tax=Vermiconidia calcicola TaxID=1690605 RepID=A0ACC3N594_9PEZI|nr:Vacuolar protein sorting-associated protein 62 [Vermiconidia calcicola]
MRRSGRRCFYAIIAIAIAYIIIGGVISRFTKGRHQDPIFDLENKDWIASSGSWADRAACNYFGICGAFHLFTRTHGGQIPNALPSTNNHSEYWSSGRSGEWSPEEKQLREIPQYIFDHAPYVHLSSREQFWPTDLAEHLAHTSPHLGYKMISEEHSNGSTSIHELNVIAGGLGGHNVYLASNDDLNQWPSWLTGAANIPGPGAVRLDVTDTPDGPPAKSTLRHHQELRKRALNSLPDTVERQQVPSGRSKAPAFLIVVPKENGIVDAFWFFFYSFNHAQKVVNIQFGNHIGDWEHTLIRFRNGKPQYISLSEHHFGAAYAWDAIEKYLPSDDGAMVGSWSNETVTKLAKRPVVYSALGSHAMYATPGHHPYILPWDLLHDDTDRGPLWDPTLNLHSYSYDLQTIRASTRNPSSPTGWFNFAGRWGDKYFKLSDPRQYRFAGQYHYMNGPYGPKAKFLDRKEPCQGPGIKKCQIKEWVGDERPKRLPSSSSD